MFHLVRAQVLLPCRLLLCVLEFRVAATGSVDHGVAAVGGGSTASKTSRKLVIATIVEGAESASRKDGGGEASIARRSDEACSGDDASARDNAVRWVVGGAIRDTTPARLKTLRRVTNKRSSGWVGSK